MNIDLESRIKRARELFSSGYNCAQSVFMAYADLFEMEPRMAATLSAPLGGGMGRLREVCGAVSGMSLLAGQLIPAYDPSDRKAKAENYALVQHFAERFREENGAIVCRELLGLSVQKEDPTPAERTAEYYRKRPCVEYVATAARIVGEWLLTH
uniref:C-GCAxxG-C-C family protein n=1 Tax=Alistipes sp. TaxID=1872444 RepID=UPI0040559CCE